LGQTSQPKVAVEELKTPEELVAILSARTAPLVLHTWEEGLTTRAVAVAVATLVVAVAATMAAVAADRALSHY
jgi:hypothetical protein